MANLYAIGDEVKCRGEFKDADGNYHDPTTVTFRVTDPSGTTTAYTYVTDPEVVKYSTGIYDVIVDADAAGIWWWGYDATGTGQAADDFYFVVEEERVSSWAATVYASVPELNARLGAPDDTDDEKMELILHAISRSLDSICHTRFYTTASDETRYYTSRFDDVLFVADDVLSITTLKTDNDGDRTYGYTWATTDYDLMPSNASLDDEPYTHIEVTPNGDYSFPSVRKGVQIVGKFGYSESAPHEVREAVLLLATKLFRRKDIPFGVAGSTDLGTVIAEIRRAALSDAEIQLLLGKYLGRRKM